VSPAGGGSGAVYRERLWAPVWLWLVASIIAGTLGLAFGVPLGLGAGIIAWVVPQALIVWVLVSAAATVVVAPGLLRAGRASLPVAAMGPVRPLDGDQAAALRGRDADARAFLLLRPWVSAAVRVDVADPRDPTPYWYISTRRAPELAAALEDARRTPPARSDGGGPDAAG